MWDHWSRTQRVKLWMESTSDCFKRWGTQQWYKQHSLYFRYYCPPVTCDLLSCTVHCDIAKVFAPEVYIFAITAEAISHVCFLNILKSLANVDNGWNCGFPNFINTLYTTKLPAHTWQQLLFFPGDISGKAATLTTTQDPDQGLP